MSSKTTTNVCEDYTIAWIAALPHERAAGIAMLDERHQQPQDFSKNASDPNSYTWGQIGKHSVVIASLPAGEYGLTTTAVTVQGLRSSLPHLRFGLLVGIGAGVPGEKQLADGSVTVLRDIRLGDVVVSNPEGTNGGVVQYDFVKAKQSFERKGFLNSPPQVLRNALSALQAEHLLDDTRISEFVAESSKRYPKTAKTYARPEPDTDRLFKASYDHDGNAETCRDCLASEFVIRSSREHVGIHYGTIASGNTLVKNAAHRDEIVTWLRKENLDPLCFEMEAAGLMNAFPCMVVRGICDYGDSHKNDSWQNHAAIAAAAFGKELLSFVDAEEAKKGPELRDLLRDISRNLEETRKETQRLDDLIEESMQRDQREKIFRWLSPCEPSSNYNKAKEQRFEGTGQWFFNSGVFESFKEGISPFLWLNGIPGCGKTVLSSSIIEDLQQSSSEASPAILYFYFDFNDIWKQTFDNALRSLLWQVANYPASPSTELQQLYDLSEEGKKQPSTESLVQSLGKALRALGRAVIVLDALDECTSRPVLLSWLAQITGQYIRNLQIIVTSRREHDIEVAFETWLSESAIVPPQELDVDTDISAYVSNRLRTDPQLRRWQGKLEVQNEIRSGLMDKANGMFRWAACQLDALGECLDYLQITEALRSLPVTLDETYARILDRIPERYLWNSIRILQVLTWSERPLRIEEAVDFLAVSPGSEPGFDEKYRMPVPREILMLCSSLVTIESTKSYGGTGVATTQEMRLSHSSVREYLTSNRLVEPFRPNLDQTVAARCIATVMLTYLLHLGSQQSPRDKTRFPLSEYSARHWMSFARLAGAEAEALQGLSMQMISDRKYYYFWRGMHDPDHPWEKNPSMYRIPQPLYYVSMEGMENIAFALLSDGADANAQGGLYGNALQAACKGGHEKVVSMLLDNRADVNAQGGHYGNALQAACREGHDKVAWILLKRGAVIDTQVKEYGNALQAACLRGYEKIVAMLLNEGTDANAIGGRYGNALQAACQGGHGKVAAMLLDKGAHINVDDGLHGTSLQAACQGGHTQVVRLLIGRGASVNAHGGPFAHALQAACQGGHAQVVRLLIEGGASVNANGGPFANALHAACYYNHDRVVEMLLDEGAEIDAQGGYHGNALQAVCYNNFDKIVDILLERGANVNSQGGEYGSALQAACARGHENIAQVLIKKGARVNAQGGWYGNALQAACQRGSEELVRLLLMEGADLSAQAGWYGNALQAACHSGHDEVVEILIAKGAEINAQGGWYGNALQAACHGGRKEVVQILLEQGADRNARGGRYGSALNAACSGGRKKTEIVSMLRKFRNHKALV